MTSAKARRAAVAALLAAGFIGRLGFGLTRAPRAPGVPDVDQYADLATTFAESGALLDPQGRPSAQREPGYPVLLGMAFAALGKSWLTMVLLNAVLGTLTLWALLRWGGALYGETVGLLALAIAAFYPPFI